MRNIVIYTDSASDLTKELNEEHDIKVMPLYVCFDTDVYRAEVDIFPKDLYARVDKTGKLPKTSAASVGDYINLFKEEVDKGNDVIMITISSGFSSTHQNALLAAEEFPKDRVAVVDSLNLSSAIGLVALKADKLRKEGKSIQEIKKELDEKIIPNVRCHFAIESLEYLHKGGRCSGASRLFGTLLQIKPVIAVNEGHMDVDLKPHGKRKALDYILQDILDKKDQVDLDYIFVTHTYADEEADMLKAKLDEAFPNAKVRITEAGCTVSSHCGKGTIGILYILK